LIPGLKAHRLTYLLYCRGGSRRHG